MIKKQFTLYLENKPGILAKITSNLAGARVNIEGISVAESTDVGLVQMVVSNAKATAAILEKARVPFTTQNVALVHLENRPGSLSRITTKLAKAGVNINYIYATGCSSASGCGCYAIISAPNLRQVEKIWQSA